MRFDSACATKTPQAAETLNPALDSSSGGDCYASRPYPALLERVTHRTSESA